MQYILRGSALLMAVLSWTTLGGTAKADYGILVDCWASSGPSWAATDDVMTVRYKINGVWQTPFNVDLSSLACTMGSAAWFLGTNSSYTASDVDTVRLSLNGSNAFWLDKLELRDSSGASLERNWGVEGGQGYCFSTQPADGQNSYCFNGTAYSVLDFLN